MHTTSYRPIAILIVLIVAATDVAWLQTPPPFRSGAGGVLVDVVARDKRGRPVLDLTQADFELSEDGKRQEIASFEKVASGTPDIAGSAAAPASAAAPPAVIPGPSRRPGDSLRITALVFDRLSQEGRSLAHQAALAYLEQVRPPSDLAGVFVIDLSLRTIQPYTARVADLRGAIDLAGRHAAPGSSQQGRTATQATTIVAGGQPTGVAPAEAVGEGVPAAGQATQPTGGPGGPGGAGGDPSDAMIAAMLKSMEDTTRTLERDQQGYAVTNALLGIVHSMRQMPGRKTVVFFSEGVPIPANVEPHFRSVIDSANRANVSIYTVDAAGLRAHSALAGARRQMDIERAGIEGVREGGGVMMKGMERNEDLLRGTPESGLGMLADQTGGLLIQNTNDLRAGMARVAEDARFHYVLGYTPSNQNFDGRYREISLKVKRPGVEIRTRRGYHALRSPPSVPILPYEAPAVALLDAPKLPNAFPVRMTALSFPDPKRPGLAPVIVEVGTDALTFQQEPGTELYTSDFTILARFKDAGGEVVRKVSQQYTLRGPMAQLDRAKRGTVLFYKDPELPPGVYSLEAIVYDALGAKGGARVATVEVPKPAGNGLRMSSLVIVRRSEKVAEKDRDGANPLYYGELLLYPSLGEPLKKAAQKEVTFFATIYAPAQSAPKAVLTLSSSGKPIAQTPVELPGPDANGRIQYVGRLPLEPLPPGVYELQLTVKDGTAEQTRTARLKVE